MKNKFFIIILVALLSLPISTWAVDDSVSVNGPIEAVNTIDDDLEAEKTTTYRQPISKRKIAKKFLAAMGGVAASSFAIFLILSVYNKLREGYINQVKTTEGEVSLETPDDLNSAVKTFLEKTNWKS